MVVLSSLMLLWAMGSFNWGLDTLRTLRRPPVPDDPPPGLLAEERLRRELDAARERFERAHPRAMTALAVANLALAAVLLLPVAAVATNDRRGRAAALLAGWSGVAFHVGSAATFVLVLRPGFMAEIAPKLAEAVLVSQPASPLTPEALLGFAQLATLLVPLGTALFGVGFSALVLRFFGGPRGRSFYGLEPALAVGSKGASG
jgi:hypothetical protein